MRRPVTKDEVKRGRDRTGLVLGMAGLAVCLLVFIYIWQRVYLAQDLAEIERLEIRNQELATESRRLAFLAQQLNSWSQVEALATTQLGMVYPEKSQIVALVVPPQRRDQGIVTVVRNWLTPVNPAWSQP